MNKDEFINRILERMGRTDGALAFDEILIAFYEVIMQDTKESFKHWMHSNNEEQEDQLKVGGSS